MAQAIEDQGTTITNVSRAVGCSRQYLARIIDGEPTIPVETYLAVCRELGINPNTHAKTDRSSPPWESSK